MSTPIRHPAAQTPAEQQDRCRRLREGFAERLDAVHGQNEPRFVRADWQQRNAELAASLRSRVPHDFLRLPAVAYQMFVDERHLSAELPVVVYQLDDPGLLREDPVGGPPCVGLTGHRLLTSSNTVHHVHHLLAFEAATGRRIGGEGTVVEWGGGYGNLAKLFVRRHGGPLTYVLIDTPVFAALQWLYLASVLGEDRVRLHVRPGQAIEPGLCNVVPVGLVPGLDVRADLFVSTWALNESSPPAQAEVLGRDWFGARSLLVAMHQGDPLERAVLDAGARPLPVVETMPAQRYFIRGAVQG